VPNTTRIDNLTRPEYEELIGKRVVIVPIGATEQHGLHLPIGTDALCVTRISERVAELTGALVAPTLAYGYRSIPRSGAGEEFKGTTGLPLSVVVATLKELLRQFVEDGCDELVVMSGHYENTIPVHEALYEICREMPNVKILTLIWANLMSEQTLADVYPDDAPYPGLDLEHGAFLETAIMLHMYPDLVKDEPWVGEVAQFPPYDVYPTPEGLVPANGSLAPSRGATAEKGKVIIDECVAGVAAVMRKEFPVKAGP
jgi:creatinine amidohydrolase